MMIETQDIAQIRSYLIDNGLETPEVIEDLQDHFCCIIEGKMQEGASFQEGFQEAKHQIAPDDIREIQETTIYYLTIKSKLMLVKGIFITAFLSIFSYVLGAILAKLLGFTGQFDLATMIHYLMQAIGLVIFGFGFLPLLFRFGYKQFVARLQE